MKPLKMGSAGNEPRGKFSPKSILSLICALALLSFLVFFLSNHIVALILSLNVVPENLATFPRYTFFYAYLPFPVALIGLDRNEMFWYFIFIVACISISIVWMVKNDLKKAIKILLNALKLKETPLFGSKNSIILVGQLLLAYYFFYTIFWGSLSLLDIIHLPGENYQVSPYRMFMLTNAPVYEEIHFRILMIGVPLLMLSILIFILLGKKLEKRGLQTFRYILGGEFKMKPLALLLIIFSSLIFAAAHNINSIYAFPPILLIGLMLGYLFLEKGIYACIVLHFSATYMDMLIYANNSGYVSGITQLFMDISIVAKYLLIAFGIVAGPFYFFYYGRSSLFHIANSFKRFRSISEK